MRSRHLDQLRHVRRRLRGWNAQFEPQGAGQPRSPVWMATSRHAGSSKSRTASERRPRGVRVSQVKSIAVRRSKWSPTTKRGRIARRGGHNDSAVTSAGAPSFSRDPDGRSLTGEGRFRRAACTSRSSASRKRWRSRAVSAEGPPVWMPVSRKCCPSARPARAPPILASVHSRPLKARARAPRARQRAASGMSAVAQTSAASIRSAIQSSAASGPVATTTISTFGRPGGRIGRDPLETTKDRHGKPGRDAIDLVAHGTRVGIDVDRCHRTLEPSLGSLVHVRVGRRVVLGLERRLLLLERLGLRGEQPKPGGHVRARSGGGRGGASAARCPWLCLPA